MRNLLRVLILTAGALAPLHRGAVLTAQTGNFFSCAGEADPVPSEQSCPSNCTYSGTVDVPALYPVGTGSTSASLTGTDNDCGTPVYNAPPGTSCGISFPVAFTDPTCCVDIGGECNVSGTLCCSGGCFGGTCRDDNIGQECGTCGHFTCSGSCNDPCNNYGGGCVSYMGYDCGNCGSYDCNGDCVDPCGDGDECDPNPCPPDEICVPGEGNAFCEEEDPVILDLDGKGFALTNAANGVRFDFYASGNPVQTSWTAAGANEGWLAMGRNGDGLVTTGKELFSNVGSQPGPPNAKLGFRALAIFDTPAFGGNGDGWIDSHDAVWPKLRVWVDSNHNGISEPAELLNMQQAGVEAISLHYLPDNWTDRYGNRFQNRAQILWSNSNRGSDVRSHWAYDVILLSAPGN